MALNKEQQEIFDSAVDLREDIQFYRPRMGQLQNVAKARFGGVADEFGAVRNMEHFNKGDLSENKKLKFIHKVAKILALWQHLGQLDDIAEMIEAQYGITIGTGPGFKDADDISVADQKKFDKVFAKAYGEDAKDLMDDAEKLLQTLLKDSLVSQSEAHKAESQLDDIAEGKAEKVMMMTKSDFKKAVAIEVAQRNGKDISGKIERVDQSLDSLENLKSLFE